MCYKYKINVCSTVYVQLIVVCVTGAFESRDGYTLYSGGSGGGGMDGGREGLTSRANLIKSQHRLPKTVVGLRGPNRPTARDPTNTLGYKLNAT